jgi:hypothetical protein
MRSYYLKSTDKDRGCRGGVGGIYKEFDNDYELEIGSQCNCSSKMMALLIHYDEIMEYLELYAPKSVISNMLVNSIKKTELDIDSKLQ